MPLHRRVPKRGFHNPTRVEYDVVNLDTLAEGFDGGFGRSRRRALRDTGSLPAARNAGQGARSRRDQQWR